ncbi:MAG: hypothetical protein R3B13_00495 [Polyangiaceae bacterium]
MTVQAATPSTTTSVPHPRAERAAKAASYDLDSLNALTSPELEAVYRAGSLPSHFELLDGHPRGRMLAVRGLEERGVRSPLRGFAAATAFPWGGKSFQALTRDTGTGINRVHLFGRHQLFPFHTRVDRSRIDGAPAVFLDYDLADNPGLIRKIHDEIREVSPGLFLGPAMWKRRGDEALVLWFALDTREQAQAIGDV